VVVVIAVVIAVVVAVFWLYFPVSLPPSSEWERAGARTRAECLVVIFLTMEEEGQECDSRVWGGVCVLPGSGGGVGLER